MKIHLLNLGLSDYKDAWDLQKRICKVKQNRKADDLVIMTEHKHVYTLGKSGNRDHLLINSAELKKKGISYYEIDRGGDLTYHGPGQLVVYPLLDLNNYYLDAHRYLRDLEETVILTLDKFGISSKREEEFTGVWVNDRKICAIGIKISRWITMHGLALNVNSDLSYFDRIIPCGIFHKGVTSVKQQLGSEVSISELAGVFKANFEKVFHAELKNVGFEALDSIFS